MKRKWEFCLKDKFFPLLTPLFLTVGFYGFLVGDDDLFVGCLIIGLLSFVVWGFVGPKLEPPWVSDPSVSGPQPSRPDYRREAEGVAQALFLFVFTKRFYEESAYRAKVLAQCLIALAVAAGVYSYFSSAAILRRANILIALCAAGMLALLIAWLLRRLRHGEEKDRAAYPTPQVNMTYDHDAAAEARIRALQQRLDRLEEWKNSGLIGKEEYEELRNKYLNVK